MAPGNFEQRVIGAGGHILRCVLMFLEAQGGPNLLLTVGTSLMGHP